MRREVLVAYIEVLDRLGELIKVCSAVERDHEELRHAVQHVFGLSPIAGDGVLSLQVRRFTPNEPQKIREALADLDLGLHRSSGA